MVLAAIQIFSGFVRAKAEAVRAGEEGRRFAWRLGSSLLGEILHCAQNDNYPLRIYPRLPSIALATEGYPR